MDNQWFRSSPFLFAVALFICASTGAPFSSSSSSLPSGAVSSIIRQPRSVNIITHLPGFHGPLPFELETGYVALDDEYGSQLFYYFVRSEGDPAKDPLLLWLTGGPGCSSFSGFVFEIGPLTFDVDYDCSLPTLVYREQTWTKASNIIFLDSPIGAGFSYSEKPRINGDLKATKEVLTFLRKWIVDHPDFSSNSFYVGGDSYSGIVVPAIAHALAKDNQHVEDTAKINLKGYLVGNPVTNPDYDKGGFVPYAHGVGFISDELYVATKSTCGGELRDYAFPTTTECLKNVELVKQVLEGINEAHILYPRCDAASPKQQDVADMRIDAMATFSSEKIRPECIKQVHTLSEIWANNRTVREALKVHEGSVDTWIRCNYSMTYIQDVPSSLPYHLNLTREGYRALVYSGDHDLEVPHVATQAWIKSFNYDVVDEWRPWWVDGEVGGYTRTFSNNLTFATIKGGGHTAVEYRPNECLAMFRRWINRQRL